MKKFSLFFFSEDELLLNSVVYCVCVLCMRACVLLSEEISHEFYIILRDIMLLPVGGFMVHCTRYYHINLNYFRVFLICLPLILVKLNID